MVYYNKGTIKRYIRKIKNKSKNVEEPYRITETVNIGLSKTSEFKNNEEVIVIRLEDFEKLNFNHVDLQNKDKKIAKLKIDLQELRTANTQINFKQADKLFNLLGSINNRNLLILNADKGINKSIDNIIHDLIKECKDIVDSNYNINLERVNNGLKEFSKSSEFDNTSNLEIAERIDSLVKENNKKIKKAGFFDLLLHKNEYILELSVDDLKKPVKSDNNLSESRASVFSKNLLLKPDLNIIDKLKIKNNNINYDLSKLELSINPEEKNNFIDVNLDEE